MKLSQQEVKDALSMLKSMEWKGITKGQPTGMGMDNAPDVSCCPSCGGINPNDGYKGHFSKRSWGHKNKCKLLKLTKLLTGE